MKELLPGIVRVGYVWQHVLQRHGSLKGLSGIPVMALGDVKWLDIVGQARCSTVTECVNGGYTETTTLEFTTSSRFPWRRRMAFVVENVSGQRILIGSGAEARCLVQVTESSGTAGSEAAGMSVKVTSKGITSAHRAEI